MIRRAVSLAPAALLAGCMTVPPAATVTAADKYIGQTLWVSPTQPLSICKNPKTKPLANIDTDCFVYSRGQFTVEDFTTSDRGVFKSYLLKVADGRSGYVEEFDVIMSNSESANKANLAEEADCKRRGGVAVGMTRAQVYASCWGKPQRINTTTTAGGDREQLVYPGYNYVYLTNGIVTGLQTSSR